MKLPLRGGGDDDVISIPLDHIVRLRYDEYHYRIPLIWKRYCV